MVTLVFQKMDVVKKLACRSKALLAILKQKKMTKTKILIACLIIFLVHFVPRHDQDMTVRRRYDMSLYNQPCTLPELDPFSPDIMSQFRRVPNIQCDKTHKIVFVDLDNELQFNQTAFNILNIEQSDVTCVCSSIYRRPSSWTDWSVGYETSAPCGPQNTLNSEFFHIKCENKGGKIVMDDLLTRINVNKQKYEKQVSDDNKYSVLMLGLDSVSRSMSKRSLNKTVKYIRDDLGAYEMKSYMKVGDNTYPNLIALLTGKFAYDGNELPQNVCFQTPCDPLPLIWKSFSQKSYVTMYAEDRPSLNAFQFKKRGFNKPPTDHYMRPFWLAAAAIFHTKQPFLGPLKDKLPGFSVVKSENQYHKCLGNTPKFMIQMSYLKQFISTYKRIPYFSFNFITDIAHEDINELSAVDDDFFNFFKWLNDDGHLDNTIVVLFSDHGPRGAQNTHTLRMENSLPLLNIIIPKSLKKKFPNVAVNLQENQRRLTSTFDLHATLRNILDSDFEHPSSFNVGNKIRGISLFAEIPKKRSCADANIPDHYCVCYRVTRVNIHSDTMVPRIAEAIVEKINSILKSSPDCAVLSLSKIIDVRKMSEALTLDHVVKKHFWSKEIVIKQSSDTFSRYTTVIETKPGLAQFYASINIDSNDNIVISDDIDRINKYGNQSHCIEDHLLNPFCYCKDLQ
ncbi:hypothetical protein ACF0H5_014372 [Mactra antiquata]